MFEIIRSWIIWFFFGMNFLFWFLVMLVMSPFIRAKRPYELAGKGLCRGILFLSAVRLKKSGLENIDKDKQYIIMMNHVSMLDPFVFTTCFPGYALAFQEATHFRWPLYGWIMRQIGHIPIDRANPRQALRDLKKGPETLKARKDHSLIIFPEGTRTVDGKLATFKKGAFLLALDAGVEILPIIQIGAYEVKKRSEWIVRPGKIKVVVKKPISIEGYDRKNVQELMQKTREVFVEELGPEAVH